MAHEIYDGNMAFNGKNPWHLGQSGNITRISENAGIEEVKRAVAFYEVREAPLYAAGINGPIPDRKALIASTDGRYLSTVGADYGVVQFSEMYEPLIRELHGAVIWRSAALLGERGERAFLLAEFPEGLKVDGDSSAYRNYLLLFNGHDGMTAAKALDTDVRVECANTVNMALAVGGKSMNVNVRHTSNAAANFSGKFTGLLKSMKSRQETFGRVANFLQSITASAPDRKALVEGLMPLPVKPTGKVTADEQKSFERKLANATEARGTLSSLVEGKVGNTREIFGSVWGAFQACAEYADHYRANRLGANADAATRLEATVDGGAANWKAEAYAATIAQWGLESRVAQLVKVAS